MAYVITGATGFIGRHLLEALAARGQTLYCVVRESSVGRLEEIASDLSALDSRIVPIIGDLLDANLGIERDQIDAMRGEVEHFFHLAALYDLSADSEALALSNVAGTRHALELAVEVDAGCFHHVSTVGVAGHYTGVFTEKMFEHTSALVDPFASTKYDAERIVRSQYTRPYRIYRPSIVVGHTHTGETDKADGIYHVFPLIRRLRESIPDWLPRVGIEVGNLNVVPVDFVAAAIDYLAHAKDLDGRTFHLVDPKTRRASEIVDEFCRAAGAPAFSRHVTFPALPQALGKLAESSDRLRIVRRVSDAVLSEARIPRRLLGYLGQSTEFGTKDTEAALEGSGIACPPLETYAATVWDYWEKHYGNLAPRDPKLAAVVDGRRALIAGADGPLRRQVALALAAAGANVMLVGRERNLLESLRRGIVGAGGRASVTLGDCATRAGMRDLLDTLVRRHGGVDVLICGGSAAIAPADASAESVAHAAEPFADAIEEHYLAPLELTLGLLEGMRARGSGHVVLLSTVALSGAGQPSYAAAAAALDSFGSTAAAELAAAGIAITAVHLPPLDLGSGRAGPSDAPLGSIAVAEASQLICDALIHRPRRTGTPLGATAELARAAAPQTFDAVKALLSRWPRGTSSGGPEGGGA